jgi:hypothetical protein
MFFSADAAASALIILAKRTIDFVRLCGLTLLKLPGNGSGNL